MLILLTIESGVAGSYHIPVYNLALQNGINFALEMINGKEVSSVDKNNCPLNSEVLLLSFPEDFV